ncbi:hypothetical protein GCM10009797_36330 [Nocardioides hwasunensis]
MLGHLLTAAVITLVVGFASGGGWAYFVVGAVLALSLWVMLFAGSYATPGPAEGNGRTSSRQYALAGACALVLGYVMYAVGDGAVWWSVGFIMAGAIIPAARAAGSQSRTGGA